MTKTATVLMMISLILVMTGCTNNPAISTNLDNSQVLAADNTVSLIGNQTIINEMSRLSSMSLKQTVIAADFDNLKTIVSSDEHASDELNEIITMTNDQEYTHVVHGLGFLSDYISTGQPVLCPGHALAHYYVFMKHGHDDMANDVLNEAKEQLPEWIPKARAFVKKYPGGQNIDEITAHIQKDIDNIDAGNTSASDTEIDYLSNNASICVNN